METCALITVPVTKSVAASSVAFTKLLMLFSLPDPIVRTKGRDTLGSAIFNCERYSWPHVQAVPRLRIGRTLGRNRFDALNFQMGRGLGHGEPDVSILIGRAISLE